MGYVKYFMPETGLEQTMEEKREVPTVTISVDEYFDLRQKAEMNGFLMERMGKFDGQLMDMDRRLYELENKQKSV